MNRTIATAFLLLVPFCGTARAQAIGSGSIQLKSPLGYSISPTLAVAYQNAAYASQIFGQGGIPCGGNTYTGYAVASGSLPTGLSINSTTGAITGTPTGTGASTFTVSFTDCSLPSGMTFTTPQLNITVATLNSITVGPTGQSIQTGQALQLQASSVWSNGNTCPGPACSFDLTTLGTWACSGTGYGSISAAGLFTASGSVGTASCTSTFNGVTSAGDTITVGSSTPTIQNSSLCNGQIGQLYPESPAPTCPGSVGIGQGVQLSASGGTPPYTWSITAGTLPTGMTLSASGLLGGTPSVAGGSGTITFKVTDSATNTSTATFCTGGGCDSLTVANYAGVNPVVVTPSNPTVSAGSSEQFTATCNFNDSTSANCTSIGLGGGGGGSIVPGTAVTVHATSSPATATVSVPSGNGVIVGCTSSGWGSTPTITISDSASQSYSQAGTTDTTYTNQLATAVFYFANSAALTNVSCASTGSPTGVDITVLPVAGLATASMLDAAASAANGANVLNLPSGALTTTNAIDALIYYVSVYSPQSSVSAGSGYTLPSGGTVLTTSGHVGGAMEYQVVSSTQSGATAGMSWSPGSANAQGLLVGFKGASGGSGTGWASGTTSVATVNGTGLAYAVAQGTSTISATVGGNTGSTTLTVTSGGGSDTGLTLTPSPAGGIVGSQVQFRAVGNVTGNNFTSTATWGSSNTSVATVVAGGLASCVTQGTSTITATGTTLTGTSMLTCNPQASGTNLLPGCTVSSSNTVNYGVGGCPSGTPAGWTVVKAEGFDSGSLGTNEVLPSGCCSFSTTAHTGSHSLAGNISGDDSNMGIYFDNLLGTYTSLYVSYWDRLDSNAYYPNNDFPFIKIIPTATLTCGATADIMFNGNSGSTSQISEAMSLQGEGNPANGASCNGLIAYASDVGVSVNAGAWRHIEILVTPSTSVASGGQVNPVPGHCSSSSQAGCGNGNMEVWLNNTLIYTYPNGNLNGTQNMQNAQIELGGFYTDFCQPPGGGACGSIANNQQCGQPWTNCTGSVPGGGGPPGYSRYVDDVIIMKQ